MQSMTGFGKAEYVIDKFSLTVEVKTVNNRFLDIVPKYPRLFICFDDLMRKLINAKVARGRLELFVTLIDNRDKDKNVDVDLSLAKSYYQAYTTLSQNFPQLSSDLSILSLMKMGDIVKEGVVENDMDFYRDVLIETLNGALDNLNEMRKVEGEKLKADMLSRVRNIETIVYDIGLRAPLIQENYRTRLQDRMKEILSSTNFDETRLLQEVALFADKSNIDEELTRLKSHISQFYDIVNGETPGRKLDFLIQEFNREANTICSKSNDLTITKHGLALKCEIEKIREQIQNVE
ncbi:MAG: YicC/YloC family endoribonuclease [Christensenellaceae bacterium]